MADKDYTLTDDEQKTSFFRVSGLDCGSCAMKIETALTRTPGVITVNASITSETVTVNHASTVSMASLANKLNGLGYNVITMAGQREQLTTISPSELNPSSEAIPESVHNHHGHEHNHSHDDALPWWRRTDGQITIACTLAIAVAYLLGFYSSKLQSIAFLLITLVALTPVVMKAWRGLRSGFPFSIESLLVVAALGALILGATEEAAFVVLLFLIGEFLESFAANQSRRGIRSLTELIPKVAFIENKDGSLVEMPISSLTIGATIVVRPGDRIPADGIITTGTSSIDDSPVTGESVPKTKAPGAPVFAGSINHEAVLRVRVTSDTANNTIARIAQLVEEAQERKSPTQRFINRFSQIYTPIVFALGLSVAVLPPLFGADWATWIYRGLAVLLIGCPCALVISTPAALASSIAAATRRGLLVKGGEVLEKLSKVTVAAFDKTGTLTNGTPSVTDIYAYDVNPTDLLILTAQVEAASSHPLAKALVAHSIQKAGIPPTPIDTIMIAGKGIKGFIDGKEIFIGSARSARDYVSFSSEQDQIVDTLQTAGKTVVTVTSQGAAIGIIGLRDELKPDAIDGITMLQKAGINVITLTGDTQTTANAIASELGITAQSELLPHDKMEIVKAFQAKGQSVVKIGDGINDAPALACADVGIAMAGGPGGGTDIALEAGDAAILQGRVRDVALLIDLAKRTMRNIHQNLAIAIGLKLIFLVTTILGITGLWPAIMADTGATILVTLNALRLLRIRSL